MRFQLTAPTKVVIQSAHDALKGAARRLFMASVVKQLGRGGQRAAEKELGWNRGTIQKGMHELRSGVTCADAFNQRGRKPCEWHAPNLEQDIRKIAEQACQTDPTFRTTQLYRRITGKEVRRQLIEEMGYPLDQVPSERTLRRKLTTMGYKPQKVAKSKPIRKIKETDAIFDQVRKINQEADVDDGTVRLSVDTKAVVAIGNLSRGGKCRQGEESLDHDFEPEQKLTPFGIFRPDTSETFLYFNSGSVTADFMVDRLEDLWPNLKKTIILHIPWS